MRIAITGATGFLGRYLARHLAGAGHALRCWYRPSSDRTGLDGLGIEWQVGQLGDSAATERLVYGCDAVVHAAVQWNGPRTRGRAGHGDPGIFFGVNLTGSLDLFHQARQAGVARFVFISSGSVHEVILPDRPLDETHPTAPANFYGAHKAAIEQYVHAYGFGEGWPICSLRPTGIYGLAHPPASSRFFDVVGQVVRGEPVTSAKGGKEVHAADVARAAELLLHADAKAIAGQAFECYDQYVSEETIARIARELTGSASVIGDTNRGPKNQIVTKKIRALGMTFGGEELLRRTLAELVAAHSRGASR